MVIEIIPYVEHKKKGYRFCQSQLLFIPKAADITQEQLDYFIDEGKRLFVYGMIPDIVKAGIYSSKSNIIRAINNGTLLFEVRINVLVDESLVTHEYPETQENTKNLFKASDDQYFIVVFPKGVHSIKYIYYCAMGYTARFEVDGEYYFYELHRRDWSDFQQEQKFYKFGDGIKFRHKHEVLTGYICCVSFDHYVSEKEDAGARFNNTYEVVIEKPVIIGSWDDNNKFVEEEKPYTYLVYEDDVVHANDIIEYLGNDANHVKDIMRAYSYNYSEEYLKEIGVFEK